MFKDVGTTSTRVVAKAPHGQGPSPCRQEPATTTAMSDCRAPRVQLSHVVACLPCVHRPVTKSQVGHGVSAVLCLFLVQCFHMPWSKEYETDPPTLRQHVVALALVQAISRCNRCHLHKSKCFP
jgi:hypothetical protein